MFKDFLNSKLTGGAVAGNKTGLMNMPKSQAHVDNGGFVEFGYGQVEPNHLSAQRNGQIYAQLPAAPSIEILEQGQFVKYDYAANNNGIGEVNFTGAGEWMLVYNEIKLYRDHLDGTKQWDCEFAMIKDDYQARIYSPYDYEVPEEMYHNGLYLNGKDEFGASSKTLKRYFTAEHPTKNENGVVYFKSIDIDGVRCEITPTIAPNKDTGLLEVTKAVFTYKGKQYEIDPKSGDTKEPIPVTYAFDDVTLNTVDPYEPNFTNDPWGRLGLYREKKMPEGTSMVPRVFKTMPGDIFTTNMVAERVLAVGDKLTPNDKGILAKFATGDGVAAPSMVWQVVKVYDMPDGQQAVKVMRIA